MNNKYRTKLEQINEHSDRQVSQENPQHPDSDSNNVIEQVSRMAKDNAQDATVPTAQDIMKEITGLSPEQQ